MRQSRSLLTNCHNFHYSHHNPWRSQFRIFHTKIAFTPKVCADPPPPRPKECTALPLSSGEHCAGVSGAAYPPILPCSPSSPVVSFLRFTLNIASTQVAVHTSCRPHTISYGAVSYRTILPNACKVAVMPLRLTFLASPHDSYRGGMPLMTRCTCCQVLVTRALMLTLSWSDPKHQAKGLLPMSCSPASKQQSQFSLGPPSPGGMQLHRLGSGLVFL